MSRKHPYTKIRQNYKGKSTLVLAINRSTNKQCAIVHKIKKDATFGVHPL